MIVGDLVKCYLVISSIDASGDDFFQRLSFRVRGVDGGTDDSSKSMKEEVDGFALPDELFKLISPSSPNPCHICKSNKGCTIPSYSLPAGTSSSHTPIPNTWVHPSCAVVAKWAVEQWAPSPLPGGCFSEGGVVLFAPGASPDVSYCVCKDGDDGRAMINCGKCDSWYHGACINVLESGECDIDCSKGDTHSPNYKCSGCFDPCPECTRDIEAGSDGYVHRKLANAAINSESRATPLRPTEARHLINPVLLVDEQAEKEEEGFSEEDTEEDIAEDEMGDSSSSKYFSANVVSVAKRGKWGCRGPSGGIGRTVSDAVAACTPHVYAQYRVWLNQVTVFLKTVSFSIKKTPPILSSSAIRASSADALSFLGGAYTLPAPFSLMSRSRTALKALESIVARTRPPPSRCLSEMDASLDEALASVHLSLDKLFEKNGRTKGSLYVPHAKDLPMWLKDWASCICLASLGLERVVSSLFDESEGLLKNVISGLPALEMILSAFSRWLIVSENALDAALSLLLSDGATQELDDRELAIRASLHLSAYITASCGQDSFDFLWKALKTAAPLSELRPTSTRLHKTRGSNHFPSSSPNSRPSSQTLCPILPQSLGGILASISCLDPRMPLLDALWFSQNTHLSMGHSDGLRPIPPIVTPFKGFSERVASITALCAWTLRAHRHIRASHLYPPHLSVETSHPALPFYSMLTLSRCIGSAGPIKDALVNFVLDFGDDSNENGKDASTCSVSVLNALKVCRVPSEASEDYTHFNCPPVSSVPLKGSKIPPFSSKSLLTLRCFEARVLQALRTPLQKWKDRSLRLPLSAFPENSFQEFGEEISQNKLEELNGILTSLGLHELGEHPDDARSDFISPKILTEIVESGIQLGLKSPLLNHARILSERMVSWENLAESFLSTPTALMVDIKAHLKAGDDLPVHPLRKEKELRNFWMLKSWNDRVDAALTGGARPSVALLQRLCGDMKAREETQNPRITDLKGRIRDSWTGYRAIQAPPLFLSKLCANPILLDSLNEFLCATGGPEKASLSFPTSSNSNAFTAATFNDSASTSPPVLSFRRCLSLLLSFVDEQLLSACARRDQLLALPCIFAEEKCLSGLIDQLSWARRCILNLNDPSPDSRVSHQVVMQDINHSYGISALQSICNLPAKRGWGVQKEASDLFISLGGVEKLSVRNKGRKRRSTDETSEVSFKNRGDVSGDLDYWRDEDLDIGGEGEDGEIDPELDDGVGLSRGRLRSGIKHQEEIGMESSENEDGDGAPDPGPLLILSSFVNPASYSFSANEQGDFFNVGLCDGFFPLPTPATHIVALLASRLLSLSNLWENSLSKSLVPSSAIESTQRAVQLIGEAPDLGMDHVFAKRVSTFSSSVDAGVGSDEAEEETESRDKWLIFLSSLCETPRAEEDLLKIVGALEALPLAPPRAQFSREVALEISTLRSVLDDSANSVVKLPFDVILQQKHFSTEWFPVYEQVPSLPTLIMTIRELSLRIASKGAQVPCVKEFLTMAMHLNSACGLVFQALEIASKPSMGAPRNLRTALQKFLRDVEGLFSGSKAFIDLILSVKSSVERFIGELDLWRCANHFAFTPCKSGLDALQSSCGNDFHLKPKLHADLLSAVKSFSLQANSWSSEDTRVTFGEATRALSTEFCNSPLNHLSEARGKLQDAVTSALAWGTKADVLVELIKNCELSDKHHTDEICISSLKHLRSTPSLYHSHFATLAYALACLACADAASKMISILGEKDAVVRRISCSTAKSFGELCDSLLELGQGDSPSLPFSFPCLQGAMRDLSPGLGRIISWIERADLLLHGLLDPGGKEAVVAFEVPPTTSPFSTLITRTAISNLLQDPITKLVEFPQLPTIKAGINSLIQWETRCENSLLAAHSALLQACKVSATIPSKGVDFRLWEASEHVGDLLAQATQGGVGSVEKNCELSALSCDSEWWRRVKGLSRREEGGPPPLTILPSPSTLSPLIFALSSLDLVLLARYHFGASTDKEPLGLSSVSESESGGGGSDCGVLPNPPKENWRYALRGRLSLDSARELLRKLILQLGPGKAHLDLPTPISSCLLISSISKEIERTERWKATAFKVLSQPHGDVVSQLSLVEILEFKLILGDDVTVYVEAELARERHAASSVRDQGEVDALRAICDIEKEVLTNSDAPHVVPPILLWSKVRHMPFWPSRLMATPKSSLPSGAPPPPKDAGDRGLVLVQFFHLPIGVEFEWVPKKKHVRLLRKEATNMDSPNLMFINTSAFNSAFEAALLTCGVVTRKLMPTRSQPQPVHTSIAPPTLSGRAGLEALLLKSKGALKAETHEIPAISPGPVVGTAVAPLEVPTISSGPVVGTTVAPQTQGKSLEAIRKGIRVDLRAIFERDLKFIEGISDEFSLLSVKALHPSYAHYLQTVDRVVTELEGHVYALYKPTEVNKKDYVFKGKSELLRALQGTGTPSDAARDRSDLLYGKFPLSLCIDADGWKNWRERRPSGVVEKVPSPNPIPESPLGETAGEAVCEGVGDKPDESQLSDVQDSLWGGFLSDDVAAMDQPPACDTYPVVDVLPPPSPWVSSNPSQTSLLSWTNPPPEQPYAWQRPQSSVEQSANLESSQEKRVGTVKSGGVKRKRESISSSTSADPRAVPKSLQASGFPILPTVFFRRQRTSVHTFFPLLPEKLSFVGTASESRVRDKLLKVINSAHSGTQFCSVFSLVGVGDMQTQLNGFVEACVRYCRPSADTDGKKQARFLAGFAGAEKLGHQVFLFPPKSKDTVQQQENREAFDILEKSYGLAFGECSIVLLFKRRTGEGAPHAAPPPGDLTYESLNEVEEFEHKRDEQKCATKTAEPMGRNLRVRGETPSADSLFPPPVSNPPPLTCDPIAMKAVVDILNGDRGITLSDLQNDPMSGQQGYAFLFPSHSQHADFLDQLRGGSVRSIDKRGVNNDPAWMTRK